jgi:hypothetical protein
MTEIQSALFDDWGTWPDQRFAQHQLVSTGGRLTRETFAQARMAGGTVIMHTGSEAQTRAAIASPLSMIASDGFIENGRGHPRSSGTYAKVLGKYVRDERVVTMMEHPVRHCRGDARRRRWEDHSGATRKGHPSPSVDQPATPLTDTGCRLMF